MKLGVIGPKDLVEQAKIKSEEFENISVIKMAYKEKKKGSNFGEAIKLIKENENKVNGYLFTGPLPYYKILNSKITNNYLFYYPIYGTAMYKALFKMNLYEEVNIENISIDTLTYDNILNVYNDLDLSIKNIKVNPLEIEKFSYRKYIDFHKNLFENGQTQGAITAVKSVYNSLKEFMPVYRVKPTKYSIENTFELINAYAKDYNNQMAVLKVKLSDENSKYNNLNILDKKQKQIALYQNLIEFSRINYGVILELENEYKIILDQRRLKHYTNNFNNFPLCKEIEEKLSICIEVGIGLGKEVNIAEERSEKAFKLAIQNEYYSSFLVGNKNQVFGPLKSEYKPQYNIQSMRGEIEDFSKISGLSKIQISKIKNLINIKEDNKITASEIARHLSVTTRTGNRIINKLLDSSLAVQIGMENTNGRGRPRKLYELNF